MSWTRGHYGILLLCLSSVAGFVYRMLVTEFDPYVPPLPSAVDPYHRQNNTELSELLSLIYWPDLPSSDIKFILSTSPKKSHYQLVNKQDRYRVGETLEVLITARNHQAQPKTYGGDFFRAKLHSPKLKAGVTGQVIDYGNGTYLVKFLLLWPGEALVNIKLIHSSEAVAVLKTKREQHPDKVYFYGFFQSNGVSEVTECNLEMTGRDICDYRDPVSGDPWQCLKPQKLPCEGWVQHSMGGYRKVTNSLEDTLLSGSVTNQDIPGSVPPIYVESNSNSKVLPNSLPLSQEPHLACVALFFNTNNDHCLKCHVDLTSSLTTCKTGHDNPQPSGFYYKDQWTTLTCRGRHFPQPSDASNCLRGKDVYMFGDSTLRQWFEYLEKFIPSLKRIDLHVNYQSGPLIAVDPDSGTVLRWRAHGLPLRTSKTMTSDLHFEAAHISGISGGPHTVVVMTLWAHFTTYPVHVYLQRLARVRKAVSSLLLRSPQTTVLIKSANTGYKSVYGSDWLSLQLDILLRAAFKGMAVTVLDAWDMTSCHYLPDNIHPGPPVIRNEVDLMLSYICPQ